MNFHLSSHKSKQKILTPALILTKKFKQLDYCMFSSDNDFKISQEFSKTFKDSKAFG